MPENRCLFASELVFAPFRQLPHYLGTLYSLIKQIIRAILRLAVIPSKRSIKSGPELIEHHIDTLTKKFALEDKYYYIDV